MRPFSQLTYLGQVRRLRRLAQVALRDYGFADARLTFIHHGENTTFRVDVSDAPRDGAGDDSFVENRYVLRIHRPGYQTSASIASELAWLEALRHDTGLTVPEPVPTLEGELLAHVAVPGVPEGRSCSLLRWLRGRKAKRRVRPGYFGRWDS